MKVLVVSGFLGAGKTTFIKELIRKSGLKPVVLENEYGDNEIDKRDISKTGKLEILEFMEGCVCCTKKDSLLNTVLAISAGLDPEYLVVEPTGVGKLGNIIENIDVVTYDKIKLLPPIVVLCPRTFDDNMAAYPDIYKNQIENAGLIVFSKIENEDPAVIESTIEKIKAIRPGIDVVTGESDVPDGILKGRYQDGPAEFFRGLLTGEKEAEKAVLPNEEADDIDEISLRGGGFDSPYDLTGFLENLVHESFGKVVRAKGIVLVGDERIRFDVADGMYAFEADGDPRAPRQSVFIGREMDGDKIREWLGVNSPKELYERSFLQKPKSK